MAYEHIEYGMIRLEDMMSADLSSLIDVELDENKGKVDNEESYEAEGE